jgi:hypothetical protein
MATRRQSIARPLKVLVPLIQAKLVEVDNAGLESKRETGDLLIEAKAQVALGSWGPWLNRHFHLSARTAQEYMQLARKMEESETRADGAPPKSLTEARGGTERDRARRAAWQPMFAAARDVDVKALAQDRQSQKDEIRLHREIALELIDIGWKALAARLHPDRGGSPLAMRRLNRVRDELKEVAAMRRFT